MVVIMKKNRKPATPAQDTDAPAEDVAAASEEPAAPEASAEAAPSRKKRKRKRKDSKPKDGGEAALTVPKETASESAAKHLRTWQEDRGNWKFAKRQQVWLLANAFDAKAVDDTAFQILTSYIQDMKGAARSRFLERATELANDAATASASADKSGEEEEEQTPPDELVLSRARSVVKALAAA
ncbi:unnamed protein product [Chrysoparadoxa australica]